MLEFLDRICYLLDRFFHRPYYIIGPGYREYIYREKDHKVHIIYESTLGDPLGDMMISSSTLVRWAPPHEDELISAEKRQQILQRLGERLKKEKTNYWINSDSIFEDQERKAAIRRRIEKEQL